MGSISNRVVTMSRLPPWIRSARTTDREYGRVDALLSGLRLHTVCEGARCPNRLDCWNRGTATLMILGDTCTRDCRFCAVPHGRPAGADAEEPARVARSARELGLRHVVVTSVTRDDLPDGGARAFAETVRALRREVPGASVEVLTPDFQGLESAIATVLEAGPDVFGHNVETVRRLQPVVRPQAPYDRSLGVLRFAAAWRPDVAVKSGLMLGLGETDDEVRQTLRDLADAGCRLVSMGQYLAPTRAHARVERYVTPGEFERHAEVARGLGFAGVAAAPLVRSSYRADELLATARRG